MTSASDTPPDRFDRLEAALQRALDGANPDELLREFAPDEVNEVQAVLGGLRQIDPAVDATVTDPDANLALQPEWSGLAADAPRIGDYAVLSELGRGGQGTVHLAVHTQLGRRVALKLIEHGGFSSDELRRFQREARITSSLEHDAIARLYESDLTGDAPFFAMQYVEGESLAARIAAARAAERPHVELHPGSPTTSSGTSSGHALAQSLEYFERAARALHAAHEHNVVHRDIKPANLMVTQNATPVVLDFGLARLTETAETMLTRTGDVVGTPGYLAPELLEGSNREADRRADVYSLGVSMYESLTLRLPFDAPTREQLFVEILAGAAVDVRRHNARVPRDVANVLAMAMAREPERRYQTAEAFADDLRCLIEHRPTRARTVGPWLRFRRWVRRHPSRAALIGVVLFALLSIGSIGGYVIARAPEIRAAEQARAAQELEESLARAYDSLWRGSTDAARDQFAELNNRHAGVREVRLGLALASAPEASSETTVDAPQDELEHFARGARLLMSSSDETTTPNLQAERALAAFERALIVRGAARLLYLVARENAAKRAQDQRTQAQTRSILDQLWPEFTRSRAREE